MNKTDRQTDRQADRQTYTETDATECSITVAFAVGNNTFTICGSLDMGSGIDHCKYQGLQHSSRPALKGCLHKFVNDLK